MWFIGITSGWLSTIGWTVYGIGAIAVFCVMRRNSARIAGIGENHQSFGGATTLLRAATDFLQQTAARLLIGAVVACGLLRIYVGDWNVWDAISVFVVLALWPLQEWLVHVLLLHVRPFTIGGRKFDLVIAIHHREHHKNPWNPLLGLTPAYMILAYIAAFIPFWMLLMPKGQALTLATTLFGLALNYEWLHYLIHTSYVPKSAIYKRLWKNHRLHHFQNEHYWYGVTMLAGDTLLGTQPLAKETPRSDSCMKISGDEDAAEQINHYI